MERATDLVTNQVVISARGYSANTRQISVVAKVKTYRRATPGGKVEPYGEIIYRNALLFLLFPQIDFAILQVPGQPPGGAGRPHDPSILNSFQLNGKTYKLDMASGSRLAKDFTNANQELDWGSFTFSDSLLPAGVGPLYFGIKRDERWKSIIYGSILHTGCKELVASDILYAVTDDTLDGLDDPDTGLQWDTGDSHAKSSEYLHNLLKLSKEELESLTGEEEYFVAENAVQFRASFQHAKYAFSGGRITVEQPGVPGKGTFAYDKDFADKAAQSGQDVKIAVPLSCMKGNKPHQGLGIYQNRVLIGTVFESEWRSAKTGWMLFQHFKWETLEEDGITQRIIDEGTKLAKAYNSVIELSKILRLDYADRAEYAESFSEEEEAIVQDYEDKFLMVVQADRLGLLLGHPYVLEQLRERLRNRWLTLAKSGGIRFYSFMTMPDESLAHYNVWDNPDEKNFCVDGRVCCCPDLAEGKYILFVNPMRNWGDVQVWENKHEGKFINTKSKGIIAAPTALFLTLGRDFDGDFVQIMHCEQYPALTKAIEEFNQPPKVRKLPKEKLTGDIRMIALNSMSNYAGLVAWLAGITIAHGYSYMPFVVPVGGIYTEEEEMTIIEFLGQELQIAVDSIKSATPNNKAGIDKLMKFYREKNLAIAWQGGFKNLEVYNTIPCPVDPEATDTISRMVRLVNGLWKEAKLPLMVSPTSFRETLFKKITYADVQLEATKEVVSEYRTLMGAALEHKNSSGNSKKLSETLLYFREVKQKILRIKDPDTGNPFTSESWASAFWYVAHTAATGRAGSVFTFFIEEIIAQLQAQGDTKYRIILILGVQYKDVSPVILRSLACTKDNPNQAVYVRFARRPHWVRNPKKKQKDGSWDYDRDANGEPKKSRQYREFCELEVSPGDWQILGNIAGQYTPNLPSIPASDEPSETIQMKLFLFPPNADGEIHRVLLLPGEARYGLGVAEITNIENNRKTSISRIYWYIWWLYDVGVRILDIKARVLEWDSKEMQNWMQSKNLQLPPGF